MLGYWMDTDTTCAYLHLWSDFMQQSTLHHNMAMFCY